MYKNKIDIDNNNTTITVTDSVATNNGQSIVDFIRNRNNSSAWLTTESTDAANTTLEINMADVELIDTIILIGHNLKSFTIQYFDSGWQNFSTPIAETNNDDSSTEFTFNEVYTGRIKIVITGTQVADSDKIIKQLIITKLLRKLEAYPEIKNVRVSRSRSISEMISGKSNFVSQVGGFKVDLRLKYWKDPDDLDAIETIYTNRLPVLVWLCGGNEDQFSSKRIGYRKEDVYLMRPANDYSPDWFNSIYSTGLDLTIQLIEAVD